MSLRDTYKELYEFELKHKGELGSALALPTGVLSIVIGALVVMAKELHSPFGLIEQAQLALIVSATLACVVVIFNLFRSIYDYDYAYLPTPGQLKEYNDELIAFYVAQGSPQNDAEVLAEADTLSYIDEQYVENADRNTANNETKSGALFKAVGSLIVAIIFTLPAGAFFVANSVTSPKEAQKFELVNLKELTSHGLIPASTSAATTPAARPASKQVDKGGSKPTKAASASAPATATATAAPVRIKHP